MTAAGSTRSMTRPSSTTAGGRETVAPLREDATPSGTIPICGDRITVYVRLDGDVIRDVSFEGSACAISIASASLMTEVVLGQTIAAAGALAERFHGMIAAPPGAPVVEDMGTLAALAG